MVSKNEAAELWMRSNTMATVLNSLRNSPKACILDQLLLVNNVRQVSQWKAQGRNPHIESVQIRNLIEDCYSHSCFNSFRTTPSFILLLHTKKG